MDWDALYAQARLDLGATRGMRLRPKPFRVVFRPFAGIRATIFHRGDHYEVRASDLLLAAPSEVHVGLCKLLVGKMDRRLRSTADERRAYMEWARSPENIQRHEDARRARGHKRIEGPQGAVHDLDRLFDALNQQYFAGSIAKPRLGWTRRPGRSLYGHHDPVHDAIVLNRLLDHPRVPEFVVADILHHEMLHVQHGVKYGATGRRVLHSRAFRMDERRFVQHEDAKRWLKDLESRRIRLRIRRAKPSTEPAPSRNLLVRLLQSPLDVFGWRPS